jgi:CHAD domain-containing protein
MNKRFVVPGVDALTPLRVAAPAILIAKAEPLFELETSARGGADMDAVHDMRVASRRLREAMRLLGPLYPSRASRTWYRRIRSITRALGPVRDSDVFIDSFGALVAELGDGGRRAVAFMVGFRSGQRIHELAVLNRELSRLDLDESRAEFVRFAHSLADTADAEAALADFAHAEVSSRLAVVLAAQPSALVEANMLDQHQLRIDYKRVRYAVEAFAPCYGDAFDDLHGTLTSFQDALGDLHDAHIFLEMLADPERTAAAGSAGVSPSDIAEVVAVIEAKAQEEFARFATLAVDSPPEHLRSVLLAPLARVKPVPRVIERDGDAAATPGFEVESVLPQQEVLPMRDTERILPFVDPNEKPWEDGWDAVMDAAPIGPHRRVEPD